MSERDERQIVIAAASGDQAAFTELVRRYRDMVYGYCYHRTANFEDSRDLAQDTFVRAYTRLGQLRDPSSFGPWLRRIAANLCNRWSAKRRELPTEDVEAPLPPPESTAAVFVREALASLPDNERLAVVLHYVDGLSYSDIAGFLEVSKDAVRGRLHRGREKLKAEVLKMTEETFGANKLDESFVLEAVGTALQRSHDAYNIRHDHVESLRNVDEAAALLDGAALDEIKDPIALGNALLYLGSRELVHGELDRARQHWDRARSIFEQAGNQDGIEQWRVTLAYERLSDGYLTAAHAAFSQAAEYWLSQECDDTAITGYGNLAVARALESLGLDADWDKVVTFHAGVGAIVREDSQVLQNGGPWIGFTKRDYPPRLAIISGTQFGLTPLPLVLIRNEPAVGDTLRFVNAYVDQAEESVLETLSETVTTPAGTFENCAYSSSRIFASDKWEGEAVAHRKLSFAPGVGIVRVAYQTVGQPEDTSELVGFHIETPTSDYIPLAVGNWWKWRWIEGEEQLGFRTEIYREIVGVREDRWGLLQYVLAVKA